MKKINYLFPILFLITLICCKSEDKNTTTYFGGKIINPKSKSVILYYFEEAIDTLSINKENNFLGKFESLKEGLYHFMHGNEFQYIYLEPKDSLMVRLNTWDFDESLVYAGKGAERNNILIDCFLEEEKQNKIFYDFNKLEPKEFKVKVDSILDLKLETFDNYVKNHSNETDGFKEILKVALTFPAYTKIEIYPMSYAYYSNTKSFPVIDADFYEYRKDISLNNDSLMYYSPYSRYIINYLYNKTYALGYAPTTNDYSEEFTLDLLNIISSEVTSETTKNAFLKQTVIGHFYKKSSCKLNSKTFDTFFKLSTNEKDKEQIRRLIRDTNKLPLNKELQDFTIIDYNHTKQTVKDIIKNKNTVLFFWSPEFVAKPYIVSRIKYLSNKYPNINFIEINIQGNTTDRIKKLDIKNQFYINKDSKAHKFLTSKMPRVVLVNKKGKVVNGYASISSNNLAPYLKELNNNK
jgi:thiol-disulfide isomerase/thioredoxin